MVEIEIPSPCIGVCSMDDITGFCQGCYRTMDEIQNWWDLDAQQKSTIVQEAGAREAQLFD
jgi:predicted Fe-S protein YdhL (DUF1289 family)